MRSVTKTTTACAILSTCLLVLGVPSLWANDPSYSGHGGGSHGAAGGHGYGKGMMHSGTGHLIRHLLKHEKDIGLSVDQVLQLKDLQLNLDKVRIKAEADIQIAERELKALTDNEKSDLAAIEAKLKQSEDQQVALRMASIKTRRDVMAILTPEQREKEKTEHEKVMQQHGKGHANPHGGGSHGAYPHGKNPHQGMGGSVPQPPSNMSVQ
ncbi:MAG: periplasmic heavy metal sensor [Nitrospira sp.]|nr:periplasmic heavy metal sensor [Nitrospira sp.]